MTLPPIVLDELRRMPTDGLEETAEFIADLVAERRSARNAMIDATSGSLSGASGEALEAALAEFDRVDESSW